MKLYKLLIGVVLLAYSLVVCATKTSTIKQGSGNCSPNTVITKGTNFNITNTCVVNPKNLKLNKLQLAHYQLIMAQNRTDVLVQNLLLMRQLGEKNFSLWAVVSNQSQFDAVKVGFKSIEPNIKTSKIQMPYTYISNNMPDSVIQSSYIKISKNSSIELKVADAEKLKSMMPEPFSDWCLYDIGDRAEDNTSEGYQEEIGRAHV